MRGPIAAAVAVCVLTAGCSRSSNSGTAPTDAATTTTATTVTATTQTSATTVVTTSTAPTTKPTDATTTVAPATTTTEPLEVSVDEWLLRVSSPSPGGTSPSAVEICYELTAPVREPVAALEVTPMRRGAAIGDSVTLDAAVGVASVTADFSGLHGTVDVQIQLMVDGAPLDGAVITVDGVTLRAGANPVTCG